MADDLSKLMVMIEANTKAYENAMKKIQQSTDKAMAGAAGATKKVDKELSRMEVTAAAGTKALTRMLAPLGILSVGGAFAGLRAAAGDIAQIGDEAERAGLSLKAFQELKFVAGQNRLGIDSLVDGLKELNLRADEFIVTGKGPAAEAFSRLGYSATDLKTKLAEPNELMLEIIGRLGELDKAAQIRIADEIFGGSGGERFVELISQGEAGLRKTIDRAHELGVVLDDEVIKNAAEIDRRFNEIAATVGTNLKGAIVSAADSLIDFIDRFRAFENQRTTGLDEQLAELGARRLEFETKIFEAQANQRLGEAQRNKAISTYRMELEKIAATEKEIIAALRNRPGTVAPVTDRTWTPTKPSSGTPDTSLSSAAKALKEALPLVEKTDTAVAKLDDTMSGLQQTTSAFLSDFLGGLRQGESAAKSFGDAMMRTLDNIIDQLANQALNSLLATIFGGFAKPGLAGAAAGIGFGLGKAGGGSVSPGNAYPVGERGPELFVPHSSGKIVPNSGVGKVGGPASVHVTVGISADQNGNLTPFVAKVAQSTTAQGLAAYDKAKQRQQLTSAA